MLRVTGIYGDFDTQSINRVVRDRVFDTQSANCVDDDDDVELNVLGCRLTY